MHCHTAAYQLCSSSQHGLLMLGGILSACRNIVKHSIHHTDVHVHPCDLGQHTDLRRLKFNVLRQPDGDVVVHEPAMSVSGQQPCPETRYQSCCRLLCSYNSKSHQLSPAQNNATVSHRPARRGTLTASVWTIQRSCLTRFFLPASMFSKTCSTSDGGKESMPCLEV